MLLCISSALTPTQSQVALRLTAVCHQEDVAGKGTPESDD